MNNDGFSYIKMEQKGLLFLLMKFDLDFLREHITFHFREPYQEEYGKNKDSLDKYLSDLKRSGLLADASEEGIQRRLSIKRVKEIREFVENESENYFPNSIVLSYNSDDPDYIYDQVNKKVDKIKFPEDVEFTVIDGQHRLAGILSSNLEHFDVPISLYINLGLAEATKIFIDINGKQKSVSRSLVYDLYSNMDNKDYSNELKLHNVVKMFNDPKKYLERDKLTEEYLDSPFDHQIKMLGIGEGTISQSFFIEYAKTALKTAKLLDMSEIEIYKELYDYFISVRLTWKEIWPEKNTSKSRTSQIAKTNGIGALFIAFPALYKEYKHQSELKKRRFYEEYFKKRKAHIKWDPIEKGTGREKQKNIANQILKQFEN